MGELKDRDGVVVDVPDDVAVEAGDDSEGEWGKSGVGEAEDKCDERSTFRLHGFFEENLLLT